MCSSEPSRHAWPLAIRDLSPGFSRKGMLPQRAMFHASSFDAIGGSGRARMLKLNNGRNLFVAALVAVMMLVQSFMLAGSAGAAQHGVLLDQFGNTLCITSVDPGETQQDQRKLPSCCVLGCGLATVGFAEPDFQSITLNWSEHGPAWIARPAEDQVAILPSERPRPPRGPPLSSR
ncbi:hypothetical protein JYU29_09100 [Tianweitania sp. BSSL-BM11]|uniref:DUF2946 domain-containing protein n=1 Tax=Tianweitania aestuarii TaxID=2814886 RepID=A0ABS5RX28_9HYPH|nr:hypothetical protein [Tianweitania aestuarii]MBS9720841.1 hypothetical protein [Tianweitania aestuarii]